MSSEFMTQLAEVVRSERERWNVPGIVVGVLHDGEVCATADGVISLDTGWPVATDTLFTIASNTKVFTTTLLMTLVDEGKVDLDAPVTTYLPGLRLQDEDALERIVVRHLVNYQTGFWGTTPWEYECGEGPDALQTFAGRLIDAPQMYPVGAFFAYNNANFCVAGALIEKVTRQQFEDVMRERILEPLGMNRTFFGPYDVFGYPRAIGHLPRTPGSDELEVKRKSDSTRVLAPTGGLYSTVADLLTFDRFHLGESGLPQIISEESRVAMQQKEIARSSFGGWQGLGWQVDQYGEARKLSHWGGWDGCRSRNVVFPGTGTAFAIFTNGFGVAAITAIERWLAGHVLGLDIQEPSRVTLPDDALERFAGTYWNPQSRVKVQVREGGLEVTTSNLRQAHETTSVIYHPIGDTAFMADPNHCDSLEYEIDFVPNGDGPVMYMRHGGWVVRRE